MFLLSIRIFGIQTFIDRISLIFSNYPFGFSWQMSKIHVTCLHYLLIIFINKSTRPAQGIVQHYVMDFIPFSYISKQLVLTITGGLPFDLWADNFNQTTCSGKTLVCFIGKKGTASSLGNGK